MALEDAANEHTNGDVSCKEEEFSARWEKQYIGKRFIDKAAWSDSQWRRSVFDVGGAKE